MITAAFIPDCLGRYYNSAVLNGFIQNATIAQQNQTFASGKGEPQKGTGCGLCGNGMRRNAGAVRFQRKRILSDIRLKKGKFLFLIYHLINRICPNSRMHIGNQLWLKKGQYHTEQYGRVHQAAEQNQKINVFSQSQNISMQSLNFM